MSLDKFDSKFQGFLFLDNSGNKYHVPLPQDVCNVDIIEAILAYVNGPGYPKLQPLTMVNHKRILFEFTLFLTEKEVVDENVGLKFLKYLKKRNFTEDFIYQASSKLKSIFESARTDDARLRVKLIDAVDNWPSVLRPVGEARPSLENLFPDFEYDNKSYLIAFNRFPIWFVSQWQSIRKEFREKMPEDYAFLESLLPEEISKHAIISCSCHSKKEDRDLLKKLAGITVRAAIGLGNVFLLEAVFFAAYINTIRIGKGVQLGDYKPAFTYFFNKEKLELNPHVNRQVQVEALRKFLKPNGDAWTRRFGLVIKKGRGGRLRKDRKSFYLNSFISPFDLLRPGREEKAMMYYYFSAQRVSASSIDRLTLKDVVNSRKKIVVQSYKARNRTSMSVGFDRGTEAFKVIEAWVSNIREMKVKGHYREGGDDSEIPLICESKTYAIPAVFGLGQTHLFKFRPFIFENSISRSRILSSESDSERIRPFLDIFSRVVLEAESNPAAKYDESRTIQPAAVSQTAVYASRVKNNFSVSDEFSNTQGGEDHLLADESALRLNHTRKTHHDQYLNRATDRQKLDDESRFAAAVGEEMLNIANKINEERHSFVEAITLNDVNRILGLPAGKNSSEIELLNEVKQLKFMKKYAYESTGVFSNGSKVIVVKTPLVASIIMAEIAHIDKSIERLIGIAENKAYQIIARRIFLSVLLNHFDATQLRIAREQYAGASFKFPDLVL
ncbi:hypothetical protein [Microbulbifer sp. MCCC 1A16149]|uniref:hypothetical protein n=1 Tax=Microbulbifer sp. MCCC 1A16149 TaxID=3411322 RepID=UPI003D0C2CA2